MKPSDEEEDSDTESDAFGLLPDEAHEQGAGAGEHEQDASNAASDASGQEHRDWLLRPPSRSHPPLVHSTG